MQELNTSRSPSPDRFENPNRSDRRETQTIGGDDRDKLLKQIEELKKQLALKGKF